MVEKVERYKAYDGREFQSQEAAFRHEAIEAMIAEVPELAFIRSKLEASMSRISIAAEPLARFLMKTTLEVGAETTLEPDVICCVNTPRGQSHHTDCPNHPDYNSLDQAQERIFGAFSRLEMAKRAGFRG